MSDQGGEFLSSHFKQLADECEFVHSFSPAYTPEHNGFAKRANRTILEQAKCMLNASKLPNTYWAEAVSTATLLSNYTPTPSRHNHSPHMLWTDCSPKIKKVVISRHIWFNESIFPELKQQQGDASPLNVVWDTIEGQEVVDELHSPLECSLELGSQEPVDEVRISSVQGTTPAAELELVDEVLPAN
ncbi:hypothetical protein O181_039578 [Austropuccinia psidii MF-1]|uniref:Integrase catalytic domain-containing protein n=1 Tax=Austropuccinia psidii MF-1 TaxID=1389203 RepID=A0A9Q3DDN6_9BASI|nr:hypothetical protein [Austropuccinia psidii MF-1]